MEFKGLKLLAFIQHKAIWKQQYPQRLILKPLGQPNPSLQANLKLWKHMYFKISSYNSG